jgi:hypothetical protein
MSDFGVQPVNAFTVRRDALRQCARTSDGWSALAWTEKIVTKHKDTQKTRELTEDELNYVSGGKGEAPVKYMEFKLKEVLISSVLPSS